MSMKLIRQANDRPILVHTLRDDDESALNLTGATLVAKGEFLKTGNAVTFNNTVQAVDLPNGLVQFQMHKDDFPSEIGKIKYWYEITYGDGDVLDSNKKFYQVVGQNE